MEPKWLEWARTIQALAQNGLTYTENGYDRERYEALHEIALSMLAAGAETDMTLLQELLANESGYATPKVDVRGVVFDDQERILLVQERSDGGWTLPGGWADVWDTPSKAVEREVWEESGYQVCAVKLLGCWDRRLHGHPPSWFRIYKLFFQCEVIGGAPGATLETAQVGFFAENAWPELSVSRTTPWELQRCFQHLRHPELPSEFD